MARPFTEKVVEVRSRRRLRYSDLANESDDARSSAWFNKLLNHSDPWVVNPPTRDTFDGLTTLLGVSESTLCQMIAEEWYGVATAEPSARGRSLGPALDQLTDDDYRIAEQVVHRLNAANEVGGIAA